MENKKIIIAVAAALIILITVITYGVYFQKSDPAPVTEEKSSLQPSGSKKENKNDNNSSGFTVSGKNEAKDDISEEIDSISTEINSVNDADFGEDSLSDAEVGL